MKTAKDLMRSDLSSVRPETLLTEAAALLFKKEVSGLPVVNLKNEVIGFFSEKDIITSAVHNGLQILNPEVVSLADLTQVINKLSRIGGPKVEDHMSKTLYCAAEDTPLQDVAELMLGKDLKRLPILKNKHLVGIIERTGLSKLALEEGL